MSIYQDAQDMVYEAFKEFGAQAWIIRKTQGEYDPVTGQFIDGVEEKHQALAMQADYSLRDISQSSGEVLVKTDDKRITIAAKSLLIIPQRTDKVEICGKVYQVLNVKEVNPAGIVIKYDVQGRL